MSPVTSPSLYQRCYGSLSFFPADVFVDALPMTPPSSSHSSDSEGSCSPRHSPPCSPVRQVLVARAGSARPYNAATALYSQPVSGLSCRCTSRLTMFAGKANACLTLRLIGIICHTFKTQLESMSYLLVLTLSSR